MLVFEKLWTVWTKIAIRHNMLGIDMTLDII